MAQQQKDSWTTEEYQSSASFVPKLATKVVQWLDVQKDDTILDLGCGDGILDEQFAHVIKQGSGRLVGLDSSQAMIEGARKLVPSNGDNIKFEVADCGKLDSFAHITTGSFNKVFSNAAMHWILGPESARVPFFRGVREATARGGIFVFEMGGLGNISEMRTAIVMAVARQIGFEAAVAADPWFFPDEAYITHMLETEVGGFKVEKVEREWRPTTADKGGVEGWVRLMGRLLFEAIPEPEKREEAIQEAIQVLKHVCKMGAGGEMLSYVRLRALARRV